MLRILIIVAILLVPLVVQAMAGLSDDGLESFANEPSAVSKWIAIAAISIMVIFVALFCIGVVAFIRRGKLDTKRLEMAKSSLRGTKDFPTI